MIPWAAASSCAVWPRRVRWPAAADSSLPAHPAAEARPALRLPRQPTGAARRGGNLKVGLTGGSGSDTLDPHNGLTYLDTARAQSLYQPLLQLNTQAQAEFVLAEDISPHGSTSEWIIKLRPGITFHDGKPLTADDVIFTLRRIITGKLTGATPLGPIDIKNLKALDKHTVKVPMTSPYGSFLDQLGLLVLPVHRAGRLRPEDAQRHRRFQVQELHARPAKRVRQEPRLLEGGTALRRHADHHRLQRQRVAAERALDRRHPRRRRARGPADHRAQVDPRRPDSRLAHRRDHAVHDAGRPGAVQRRPDPPGHAPAGRSAAADHLGAERVRDRRLRRLLAL